MSRKVTRRIISYQTRIHQFTANYSLLSQTRCRPNGT